MKILIFFQKSWSRIHYCSNLNSGYFIDFALIFYHRFIRDKFLCNPSDSWKKNPAFPRERAFNNPYVYNWILLQFYRKSYWYQYCIIWQGKTFCLYILWTKNSLKWLKSRIKFPYIDKSLISYIWVWKFIHFFFNVNLHSKEVINTLIWTYW